MSTNQNYNNYQGGPRTTEANTPVIPAEINTYSLRGAAAHYADNLGFAVHPLTPSGSGDSSSHGNRPITSPDIIGQPHAVHGDTSFE